MARKSIQFAAFRTIHNQGLGVILPSRLKILDWGVNKNTNTGEVILDEESAKLFESTQKAIGRERVALDFEHNTAPGSSAYEESAEPRPVAAYGTPRVIPNEGLFLDDLKWTPEGEQNARNYEDLSPAPFLVDKRVIGLHSCALTRAGAVEGLHFFSSFSTLDKVAAWVGAPDAQKNNHMKDHIKKFRAHFNLPETMSDDDVMKHAADHMTSGSEPGALKFPGNATGGGEHFAQHMAKMQADLTAQFTTSLDAKIKEMVTPLTAKVEALTAANADAEKRAADGERASLIAQAARNGQILPLSAESLKTVSPVLLKEIVENTPKGQVNMKATMRTLGADGKPAKMTMADTASVFQQQFEALRFTSTPR